MTGDAAVATQPCLGQAALEAVRAEFRAAREQVLKDAEAFDEVIFAVERLGVVLTGRIGDLGKYKDRIWELAQNSALATTLPQEHRSWHTPFKNLYSQVRQARNDAVHQGAYARHLSQHVIELCLVLEDALMTLQETSMGQEATVADFMVRDVVCAHAWEPVSFVRQRMLTNSFTYLPILTEEGWHLVSDSALVTFLRPMSLFEDEAHEILDRNELLKARAAERKRRMATTVEAARRPDVPLAKDSPLRLVSAADRLTSDTTRLSEILPRLGDQPMLVVNDPPFGRIRGIIMAFDLL